MASEFFRVFKNDLRKSNQQKKTPTETKAPNAKTKTSAKENIEKQHQQHKSGRADFVRFVVGGVRGAAFSDSVSK